MVNLDVKMSYGEILCHQKQGEMKNSCIVKTKATIHNF